MDRPLASCRCFLGQPAFDPGIAAAILPLAVGAGLLLTGGGLSGPLPWGALLPVVLAAHVLAGWLPASALAAGCVLAWPADAATQMGFTLAAGAQVALVALMRACLRRGRDDAERLQALLEQERALLLEMQHRIANALQFLSSLLVLQADRVSDAACARDALTEAAARLGAVARIHRRLHDPRLSGAGLGDLLRDIAAEMLAARGIATEAQGGVRLRVTVAEAARDLGTHRATAVAMIVAEAATNAAKHAFDATSHGALRIVLAHDDAAFVLTVADDGPGPPQEAPLEDSLGLTVMQAMARRLAGTFRFGAGACGGAEIRVAFPARPPQGSAASFAPA